MSAESALDEVKEKIERPVESVLSFLRDNPFRTYRGDCRPREVRVG
jgi:hypothetical protein